MTSRRSLPGPATRRRNTRTGKAGAERRDRYANYTTPADIIAAAQLVRKGKVISPRSTLTTPAHRALSATLRWVAPTRSTHDPHRHRRLFRVLTSAASAPPTTWSPCRCNAGRRTGSATLLRAVHVERLRLPRGHPPAPKSAASKRPNIRWWSRRVPGRGACSVRSASMTATASPARTSTTPPRSRASRSSAATT